MKNFFRPAVLAVLAVMSTLQSCDKADAPTPTAPLTLQHTADGSILDLRGSSFAFPGRGATYNGTSTNLTNLDATEGSVLMVRKNFLEQAGGGKITSTWNSAAPLDPTAFKEAFPYQYNGIFIDQDPRTYGYVVDVSFSIDKFGNASATLKWNGAITSLPSAQ